MAVIWGSSSQVDTFYRLSAVERPVESDAHQIIRKIGVLESQATKALQLGTNPANKAANQAAVDTLVQARSKISEAVAPAAKAASTPEVAASEQPTVGVDDTPSFKL